MDHSRLMSAGNKKDLLGRLGRLVREARVQRRWTVGRLAQEAGYSRSMISQVENGKNAVAIAGFAEIAMLLGVDVNLALGLGKWKVCPRCSGRGRIHHRHPDGSLVSSRSTNAASGRNDNGMDRKKKGF